MSKYLDTITYFTNLAKSSTLLRHEGFDGYVQRKAFVSISDEEELMANLINNLAEQFAVQVGFNGSTTNSDGGIADNYTHSLRFYVKATVENDEQVVIENAYDQAFNLAKLFKQKIMNDSVSADGCGALPYIDLGSFVITKLPPLYNNHFGFQLTFTEQLPNASYLLPDNNYWN